MLETSKVALIEIVSPLGKLWQNTHYSKISNKETKRNFPNISETIENDESDLEAAIRGIKEELNLDISDKRFIKIKSWSETKISTTTGNLKNYYFYLYKLVLSEYEANQINLTVDEGDSIIKLEWRNY